jgi:threonine/homoserine/homoserine lactone efflux protein
MFSFIAQGVSIGFSAGATPGPFLSYLISVTLALGWRRSIIVILTPLITDGPIILLMVFLLKQFPPQIIQVMQVGGGLYLLWIAYGVWKQFRAGNGLPSDAPPQSRTLMQGLVMNWLSPAPYIFWATINGPLLIQALNLSVVHALAFMVAFYGTFLFFLALWVALFDWLRRLDRRVIRGIYLLILLVLVAFSLSLIGQGLGILGG